MTKRRKKVLNVTDGGRAFPIAPGYFLMKGRTHEQGGIGIGNNLEVEDGEIIKTNKKSLKVLSNAPIMNGISPAQIALGGLNNGTFEKRFNQGFKYQERFKDKNGLKDDGTKAQLGKNKKFEGMYNGMFYVPEKQKEVIINPPLLEGQVYKEIKDYIGGTPSEARMKAFNKMPRIKERISELAETYGIDKNVLAHRLTKEGWIDKRIQEYNKASSLKQRDFWDNVILKEVNAFEDLGLDDAAINLAKGNYNMRNELPFWTIDGKNEKGRKTYSILANNLFDALEFQAADMEYRQNELRKRGISEENINTYVNAAYNLGLYHKDLENADWIKENYTVPNYYKLGGMNKIYIKPSKRGTFTKAANQRGLGVQAFANKVLANKENYSPSMVKKANFAKNASKWNKKELGGGATIPSTGKRKKAKLGLTVGDWVNLGGNVLGLIGSTWGSSKALAKQKDYQLPTPYQAAKLKTNINIKPQLNELRRTVDKYNKFVDRNTASSQVAYNRRLGNELSFLENYNQLYGQKENIETQLINQDRLNQQEIANKYIQDVASIRNLNIDRYNRKLEGYADINTNLLQGITDIGTGLFKNLEDRKRYRTSLKLMPYMYPEINKEEYNKLLSEIVG